MNRALSVGFAISFALGCGGRAKKPAAPEPEPSEEPTQEVSSNDDDFTMESSKGHLDPSDIDEGLAPISRALTVCYTQEIPHNGFLSGETQLHFVIGKKGAVESAHVMQSSIGSSTVETCLETTAMRATFKAPRGGPVDFDLPLAFTGARRPALDATTEETDVVATKLKKVLDTCNTSDKPNEISISAYVGPGGAILAAGFSNAESIVPTSWRECAVQALQKTMVTDPKGRIKKHSWLYRACEDGGIDKCGV